MENNNMESMIPKRRALGRGLEELFSNEVLDYTTISDKIVEQSTKDEIVLLPLSELRPNPYQPRKIFDEEALKELSDSIKEHGVFQPIIVKKAIKGYEIIAGERRVKASLMAGKKEIPAIIRDFNDTQMMEIALLENLQRENLTPIEEATAYKKLQETLSLTQEELAKRLGKSRSHLTNMLGLLTLPEIVKEEVNKKTISMAHARVLSKLDNKVQQEELLNKIITDGISVRELEELTQEPRIIKTHPQRGKDKKENEYLYLQNELSERLGTKVSIKKNKIEISFVNANDLNRLLEELNIEVG
ncbi:MAG: ParB/RepB/Spo0J family partition protein [Bacilli bacterium]|nr:ParB/RepB/Spo0J family partition protein [Bacilli bacterium]